MAPRTKRSRGVGSRLTAKVGLLPVWAWAALILGAYFLYTRLHSSSSSASTDTSASTSTPATPSTDTTGSDTGATGSSSTPVDSSGLLASIGANQSAVDALTSQILSQPSPYSNIDWTSLLGEPVPVPTDTGNGQGVASQPTPAPTTVSAAHPTQTTAGVLKWGGITFTTKAQFNSWATAHGTTATKELSNHPQARAIYSTLK